MPPSRTLGGRARQTYQTIRLGLSGGGRDGLAQPQLAAQRQQPEYYGGHSAAGSSLWLQRNTVMTRAQLLALAPDLHARGEWPVVSAAESV